MMIIVTATKTAVAAAATTTTTTTTAATAASAVIAAVAAAAATTTTTHTTTTTTTTISSIATIQSVLSPKQTVVSVTARGREEIADVTANLTCLALRPPPGGDGGGGDGGGGGLAMVIIFSHCCDATGLVYRFHTIKPLCHTNTIKLFVTPTTTRQIILSLHSRQQNSTVCHCNGNV